MPTLFSDDFESGGLSNWTGTNGTITVNGASAHNGSFGCDANANDEFAYKDFTSPVSKFVSHAADVKIVSASGTGLFRILQISAGTTYIAQIIYDNGVYKLRVQNVDNSIQTATISGINTGTWYRLRIDYDWTVDGNLVFKAYVDGVEVAQLIDTNTNGRNASRVFILTFEDVATTTAQIYFDDVTVLDTAPAGGTTYNETGGAQASVIASANDVSIVNDAGSMILGAISSGNDLAIDSDTGSAVTSVGSSASDTMTMIDTGGATLNLIASGVSGDSTALKMPTKITLAGNGRSQIAINSGKSTITINGN